MAQETQTEGEYRNIPYTVYRTDSDEYDNGFEYEFVGEIRGMEIITAGQLETRGWEKPWATAIERYLKAHIDGALYADEV
jgi:hypothetical protein